jgi:outer membrane protein assembly factor BamE (lipoprotein component of BamABCDE complex)
MKTAFTTLWLLSAVLLTGCVPFGVGVGGAVPVPSLSKKKIEQGREITAREIQFVVPGRTTGAEVVTQLGNGFRDSPRVSALAYSWQYEGGFKIIWGYGFIGGYGESGVQDFGWRALFVAFDQDGRVVQSQYYRLKGSKSLDEQLEDWAQRHGAASLTSKLRLQAK